MDDRARSIREKEPKQALRGPRMRDAVAVDSSGKRRPFPSHVRVARLIAKTLPMVKRLPHNFLVEFTRLMNERTAEGSAVARGQPQTEGKKAAKVGKTERCLGTMEYSQDEADFFLNTPLTVIMDALVSALQLSKLERATVRLYGGEGLSGCMGGDRETGVCDLHLMNCVLERSVRGSKAGGDGMDGGGGTVVKMAAFSVSFQSKPWEYGNRRIVGLECFKPLFDSIHESNNGI